MLSNLLFDKCFLMRIHSNMCSQFSYLWLHTRHCTRNFTYIISNSSCALRRLLLPPFYKRQNWGSDCHLPKGTVFLNTESPSTLRRGRVLPNFISYKCKSMCGYANSNMMLAKEINKDEQYEEGRKQFRAFSHIYKFVQMNSPVWGPCHQSCLDSNLSSAAYYLKGLWLLNTSEPQCWHHGNLNSNTNWLLQKSWQTANTWEALRLVSARDTAGF